MSVQPEVETSPIWLWEHGMAPTRPGHRGEGEADVLVVGAGLAGTAAAYYLAGQRPDLQVVLVEASHIGLGATGRSTGIVGPGVSMPMRSVRRRYGDAVAADAFASTLEGPAEVARLVQTERIDCDARREQHVVAALTGGQEGRMRRHTTDLAGLGFPVSWLTPESVAQRLGGSYRAAFAYDDVLLVDPYRLVTGLAAAAERRGVRIHERTRVTRLEARADRVLAHAASGVISAGRVLLAVDGYAGELNPHAASVVPVRTHVVATEPLSDGDHAALGWDGFGAVIDQRSFFSYYRLGAGGRLLFGGGPALLPTGDPHRDLRASAAVFARVEQQLRAQFPRLRAVRLEARWSGLTGGTLDRLPVVGVVPGNPRVHFAGGWCGHGLSMCVGTARRYAQLLAGGRPVPTGEPLPWMRSGTTGVPSGAFRAVALPAYLRLMDMQDQLAMAHARRSGAGRTPAVPTAVERRPGPAAAEQPLGPAAVEQAPGPAAAEQAPGPAAGKQPLEVAAVPRTWSSVAELASPSAGARHED